jgi:hypothetical protein
MAAVYSAMSSATSPTLNMAITLEAQRQAAVTPAEEKRHPFGVKPGQLSGQSS